MQLQFYIDVSGQPKDTLYVGLLSIKNNDATILLKGITKKDPAFFRNKQKASKMHNNEVDRIIRFLNGNSIRMANVKFKASSWSELLNHLDRQKENNVEKIFASLYFTALKIYSKPGVVYPVTVCVESFMDIEKVVHYLRKISKANGYNYQISIAQARNCDMLKFADMIAASERKNSNLRYEFLKKDTPDIAHLKYYLNKLKN